MTSTTEKRAARRAELVRRLTALAPKNRLDAMLEEVDGKALVRSLPAEDVYATIIDVGLADSTEIVQLSTPEQFRTYVDLAAWQRDRMDPLEVLHWLRAARGDDEVEFVKKLTFLDIETLEYLFKRLTAVHDLEADPDANPQGTTVETPDNRYLIEFLIEGVDESALRRLVMDLMAHNPFELSRFLEAVRFEMTGELEETAYQFRQARLEDLGFPPFDEAVKVFTWLDPDKHGPTTTNSKAIASAARVDYVPAAFAGLEPVERQNLEGEVRYLVNCVLVAESAEPGDPPSLRRYSEHARDYLDLGLEHLTGGDPSLACEVVREKALRFIFQVGFSLTMRLKRQVERMASETHAKFADTWLALDEETAMLLALLRRRPLKALRVPGAEPVPFRSKRELYEVEQLLGRVRAQRQVFAALLGASPAEIVAKFGLPFAELTPQRMFASAVVRAELDGVLDVAPVSDLRTTELCQRIFEGEGLEVRLRASAGLRAAQVLTDKLGNGVDLKPMIDRVLQAVLAELGAIWAKDEKVDPKRVHAFVVAGY